MPVYHFTFHAYRSWNADHPEGYYQRGEPGKLRPSPSLGYVRDRLAKQPPITFTSDDQEYLLGASQDAVTYRKWRLYGVTAIESHMHLVVGWNDSKLVGKEAQSRLKRALGFLLAERHGTKGVQYFSRGGSPERVINKKHLLYLLDEYLPDHNGPYWRDPSVT